ncbi:MAG: DMT family transporter [Desulfobacteraceae bacterium]|nr:DMT family transporter [Desulfobacteraceae bacterium]
MITYIKLVLTAIFWGGTFVAGRILSPVVGPFSAAFIRFAIASFCLLMIIRSLEGKLPLPAKKHVFPLILLGLSGVFAYNAFFFSGLKSITAGRASVIIANNPIVITLFAAIFFHERLTLIKVAGILISVSGALIAISRGDVAALFSGSLGMGEFYIFCCVLSWATFSLIGKVVLSDLTPMLSVGYSAFIGTIALLPPALWEGVVTGCFDYTVTDWLSLGYLGIFGTVLGFVWYYDGIQAIGPSKASLFINLVPISAILSAYIILDEPISSSLLVGVVFVVTGIYMTTTVSDYFRLRKINA